MYSPKAKSSNDTPQFQFFVNNNQGGKQEFHICSHCQPMSVIPSMVLVIALAFALWTFRSSTLENQPPENERIVAAIQNASATIYEQIVSLHSQIQHLECLLRKPELLSAADTNGSQRIAVQPWLVATADENDSQLLEDDNGVTDIQECDRWLAQAIEIQGDLSTANRLSIRSCLIAIMNQVDTYSHHLIPLIVCPASSGMSCWVGIVLDVAAISGMMVLNVLFNFPTK
jgi:hypothetical protein